MSDDQDLELDDDSVSFSWLITSKLENNIYKKMRVNLT